jgi:hypothetical protein
VSVKANLHIEECKSLPCINVALLNPGLYSSVSELNKVRINFLSLLFFFFSLSSKGSIAEKATFCSWICHSRVYKSSCFDVSVWRKVKKIVLCPKKSCLRGIEST